MTYSPWADAGERLQHIDIRRAACGGVRGAWVPEERMVLLSREMLRADRNSTLAHEIAHIDLEHKPQGVPWFARRQETDADTLAAERLIAVDDLADALCWALGPAEVATLLDVTLRLLLIRIRGLSPGERTVIDERVARADWGAA